MSREGRVCSGAGSKGVADPRPIRLSGCLSVSSRATGVKQRRRPRC